MADFETLVVRIVGDSSGFERAMSRSSASAAAMGSKMRSIGRGMSTYVSLPLAAAGAASVKMAADFEQSITNAVSVTGLAGKAAAQARTEMNNLALQLGADTAFSAKEAADAMYDLASSGWNTQQMAKGLPGIMNLAAATQSDLATTTGVVTSTLSQFGLKAQDSGRVADVFTKAISATRLKMDDLVIGMKYIGPVAEATGISLEETAAAMGALADQGISSQTGARSLRDGLTDLLNPTDSARAALEEMGVAASDVNPETHSLAEIMGTLGKAGMTAGQATAIFGKESMSAMLALSKTGGPALENLTQKIKDSGGAAKNTAEMQLDTLKGSMERLKGAASTLAIQVGQALTPVIRGLADGLELVVDAFTKIPAPIRTAIVVMAALAAVAGPLIWIAGSIVSAWGTLMGISAVATVFSSIGAAIAGALSIGFLPLIAIAAAVVGAGLLIWKFWKPITGLFKTVAKAIAGAVGAIVGAVMRVTEPVRNAIRSGIGAAFMWLQRQGANMVSWFKQNLPLMGRVVQTVFGGMGSDARSAFNIIRAVVTFGVKAIGAVIRATMGPVVGFWKNNFDRMKAIAGSAFKIIKITLSTAVRILGNVIKLGMQVITGDWKGAWNTLKRIVQLAWNGIRGVAREYVKIVGNVIKIGWNAIKATSQSVWNLIKLVIVNRVKDLANGVRNLVDGLRQGVANRWQMMADGARSRWDDIKSGITNRVDEMRGNVLNLIERLRGGVAALWEKMTGGARAFGDSIKSTLMGRFADMVNGVRKWLGYLASGLGWLLGIFGVGPAGDLKSAGEQLKAPVKFARGGVYDGDRGGIAGPGRMGIVGEAGDREAIVNLERYTPESAKAFEAALNSPAGRRRNGRQQGEAGISPVTLHSWDPSIEDRVHAIANATGTSANTYPGHGEPGGSSQSYTADFWGKGGRGAPIGKDAGYKTADLALSKYNSNPGILYMIRQGKYWRDGNWKPWPQDPHYDHTHISWDSPGGASAGASSGPDFGMIWGQLLNKLSPFPSEGLSGTLLKGLGDRVLEWARTWAEGLAGSMGSSGTSPSGLNLREAVMQGGFPSSVAPTAIGVAWEESGARADAQNPSGARGLFQIMPQTAKGLGADYNKLKDPIYNAQAAKKLWSQSGWGPWAAYPPSGASMRKGDAPVTGYSLGGIIPGPLGKQVLMMAHAGERVLPRETTQAFDRLAESITRTAKHGNIGNANVDKMGAKIEKRLDHVVERLDRQLGKMATKDELAEVSVRANHAFSLSSGNQAIHDLLNQKSFRRIRELTGV